MAAGACAKNYILFDFDPEGDNSGRTVANFLLLPVGAQQLAVGLVPSMVAWDATDVAMATGNTAFFSQYQFAVTHLEWLMGLRKEYAAGCIPILDVGTVGFYSQVFTLGSFDNARDIDEYAVSSTRSVEVNVGASFARELIPQVLGVGATASYIESRLAGDDGRAFNASVDGTYRPTKKLAARGYLRNLGSPLKYNETPEPLPLQIGLAAEYSPIVADDTLLGRSFSLSTALGMLKTADLPLQIAAAVEGSPFKVLTARVGYEYSYGYSPSLAGLSFGAGLAIKGYGADVGFKYQSPEFGWVWSATVKYATEEIKQKAPGDYYKIAEKHFKKGRYNLCIQFAERALKLNPDLWQAHELIRRCIAIMRREKGMEIGLVYTGNIQGQFAPFRFAQATLGGLARQAAAIKRVRQEFPTCVVIDAGNFVKANSHQLKAEFAGTYYKALAFDAVGLGPGEIDYGLTRYLESNKKAKPLFVCSNLSTAGGVGVSDMKIVSAGKYELAVFDIAAPAMVVDPDARAQLTPAFQTVQAQLASDRVKKCNLRVLILHAPWEVAQAYVKHLPAVDIVILGSLAQKFDVPMKVGSTIFLSAGEYGKYVGALTLRFDKKGHLLSYNNRLIPLIEEVPADPEIDQATRTIIAKIDLDEQGLAEQELREVTPDGVFAFVSDRRGASDVFLKVPLKLSEFPLTATHSRCVAPRISFGANRIVYLEDNDSTRQSELKVMALTGADKLTLAMPGETREACFSADGKWVFAAVQSESGIDIYRIKSIGGEAIPVVTWPDADESQIDASVDTRHICFASDRDGKWQIYLADTSGTTPVRITDPNAQHVRPKFSPDGNYIAYLSDRHSVGGRKDIWVHTIQTGEEIRVTGGTAVSEFCWLPDGKTIVFVGGIDTLALGRCDVFTQEKRVLIERDSAKAYNETSPRAVTFKGETRIVYVREYEDGEKRIYWVDPAGKEDRAVVNSEKRDWLE